jgi:hypothetical protein
MYFKSYIIIEVHTYHKYILNITIAGRLMYLYILQFIEK